MTLGSTQPLTEMSEGVKGKGGRCIRLTTLPTSCAVAKKSGKINFLQTSGPLRACIGTALPLPFTLINEATLKLVIRAGFICKALKFVHAIHIKFKVFVISLK